MGTPTMTARGAAIESINPATEEVIATFEQFTPAQIEQALVEADAAFRQWRRQSFGERSTAMRRAAELLRSRKNRYAGLITAEMGKPITQAEAEVEKCAWVCEYFADNAERFLGRQPAQTNARLSYVAFEPLGVVLAVMPWNFPFWQVFRFAAPTLMAGNTAVLKHASNVPQCALAIEEVFRDAGFPRGVLRTVLVPGGARRSPRHGGPAGARLRRTGRAGGARRRSPARPRLFLSADARPQPRGTKPERVAGMARGGIRAGSGAGARQGHGRGDRARERHDLRARRQSVDARPRARASARLTNRSRLRVHQRHGRFGPAPAVRRRETERLWARAVRLRAPRIREHPDGVDERR